MFLLRVVNISLPKVIAGPCSAESEEQILRTAAELKEAGVEWFRAGLWKPRTMPGCFEGVGEKGLPWLQKVKEQYQLKICTEVASARHVDLCLNAGLDMVWIGARTTANPFLVQEIADAMQGAPVKVFVKNPITPDRGLWAGAIERLRRKGVEDISVVHRGFSTFDKIRYRYAPCWDIAIQFRTAFPEIPFWCDPSHMAGDVAFIPEIAQKALDLGLDGLMIESHCCPSEALSDSRQQLTPADLCRLLQGLTPRRPDSDSAAYRTALESLRARIDALDSTLVETLSQRMEASREIGRIKKENNVAILQTVRWDEVVEGALAKAEGRRLDLEFITRIFNEIHDASVAEQNKIISEL